MVGFTSVTVHGLFPLFNIPKRKALQPQNYKAKIDVRAFI